MRYLEDFELGTVEAAGSVELSEAEIVELAARDDPQPFHVDAEAARASINGGLIACGWQTIAVTMRLLVDNVFDNTALVGSPGVDEIRWHRPVRRHVVRARDGAGHGALADQAGSRGAAVPG